MISVLLWSLRLYLYHKIFYSSNEVQCWSEIFLANEWVTVAPITVTTNYSSFDILLLLL